jgi:hypothetical protein
MKMMSEHATGMTGDCSQVARPLPKRCAIVVANDLSLGRLTNAVAVVALTIGQRHPELVGEPLIDKSGFPHPGLIPVGIAVLGAPRDQLPTLRERAIRVGCDVIDFPVEGQLTTDYDRFRNVVASVPPLS